MYHRFHGRLLQGQTLSICWITPKSHCQCLQIVILTNHQFMPEGIFHTMHRRRNIRSPATTDQALRAARPKGLPERLIVAFQLTLYNASSSVTNDLEVSLATCP